MSHKNSPERGRKRQKIRILHPFRNEPLGHLKIDIRFTAKNASDDALIEVPVRQEANLQEGLGRVSSLARRSLRARLSGNGGWLIPISSASRS